MPETGLRVHLIFWGELPPQLWYVGVLPDRPPTLQGFKALEWGGTEGWPRMSCKCNKVRWDWGRGMVYVRVLMCVSLVCALIVVGEEGA